MSLRKEIALVLLVKVVLLYLIWEAWFDHALPKDQRMSHVEQVVLKK